MSGDRFAEINPKRIIAPINVRMMPITSSLRSAERVFHHEKAGGGGVCSGGVFLLFDADLLCDTSPFFEGRILPAGFVFFLGGVEGFKRGMKIKG